MMKSTTSQKAPVESKVYAATLGGGAGATISAFVTWALGVIVWHVPFTADRAGDAIAAVPWPVTGFAGLLITAGGAFAGGFLARHTTRPAEDAGAPAAG